MILYLLTFSSLFLVLLSAGLNYIPRVSGVTINGFEYLLSQYADDSALILGDDLEQALKTFDCFSICAGLWANLHKTEAIWIGSRLSSYTKLIPEKHIAWNTWENLNFWGIHFNLYKDDKTLKILVKFFFKKGKEYRKLKCIQGFNLPVYWSNNCYTSISLPASRFSQTLLLTKEIQDIFYNFWWDEKPEKKVRENVINNYDEGG